MSKPELPPEIIAAIVNQLQDRSSLEACSLVSLSFLFPSQSQLFREVNLETQSSCISRRTAYINFHNWLLENPHLGVHIQSLHLGDDNQDDFHWDLDESWILERESTLSQTLSLLPRLQNFSLTFNSEIVDWSGIPHHTRSAFLLLFQLPTLKAVSLNNISSLPSNDILPLLNMERLALSFVEIQDTGRPIKIEEHQRGSSHIFLYLQGVSAPTITAVTDALSKITWKNVHTLSIAPTFNSSVSGSIHAVNSILAAEVTALEWLPSADICSSTTSIEILNFVRLQSLRFKVNFRKCRTGRHGLTEVLRTFKSLSESTTFCPLVNLTVDCYFITKFDEKSWESDWRALDEVLSEPIFSSLREVNIRLSNSAITSVGKHHFIDLLPTLRQRGVKTLCSTPI